MSVDSGIGRRRQAARTEGGADYKARREELVKVAAEVFQEKGYQASTLNDIAERMDTDRASLYYYVGSKQELFQEVVQDVLEANLREARRIKKEPLKPAEKLARLVNTMMVSYEENYPFTYVYIQEDMSQVGSQDSEWARAMTSRTRSFEKIVKGFIEEGVAAKEFRADIPPEIAANGLYGMLNWTHRWFRPGGGADATQVAAAFSSLLLEGLRN
jgi:TetR/AcrR family transcriptional regulator, cholesterol catabolism regulator